MLTGLTHVAISVTDMDRSIDFYKQIPGVTEQFRLLNDDGSVRLVYLRVGPRQFIELFQWADCPSQKQTNAGCVHFSLETDNIHEMYECLINCGMTPEMEPTLGAEGSWRFVVEDPDGIIVELQQFTPDSLQIKNN